MPIPNSTTGPKDSAPFVLEKALSGHPLIARNGAEVTHFMKGYADGREYAYCARVGGMTRSYTKDGKWRSPSHTEDHDLFLHCEPGTVGDYPPPDYAAPFEVRSALNGHRLVTRNGSEATAFRRLHYDQRKQPYGAIINHTLHSFDAQGRWMNEHDDAIHDLYLDTRPVPFDDSDEEDCQCEKCRLRRQTNPAVLMTVGNAPWNRDALCRQAEEVAEEKTLFGMTVEQVAGMDTGRALLVASRPDPGKPTIKIHDHFRFEPYTEEEAQEARERFNRIFPETAQLLTEISQITKVKFTERALINTLFEVQVGLEKLGWMKPEYCPKDGTLFRMIDNGSAGIFDCYYHGDWPGGEYVAIDDSGDGDCWTPNPILIKPYTMQELIEKEQHQEGSQIVGTQETTEDTQPEG